MSDYRPSTVSSRGTPAGRKKKYVTRACDACKRRKSKCDGCEPCIRCVNSDIECSYVSLYKRVRRSHPYERRPERQSHGEETSIYPSADDLSPRREITEEVVEDPGLVNARVEGDSGDASVYGFLRRVSGHLALIGQGLPRNLFKREEEVLTSGDGARVFILPPKDIAKDYLKCFFEHASITYRYMSREQTFAILDLVYDDDETTLQDNSTMAMLLLLMGCGCIWTASWRNQPLAPYRKKAYKLLQVAQARLESTQGVFPPTLRLIQAYFLKCQLELAASRFNSAWMTLGQTIRLGQVIDIQKEQTKLDPLEEYWRKGLFWSMYMVDRYLAVSLGRPMAILEADITIPFPPEPNPEITALVGPHEAKVSAGVVAHARLTRIAGHAVLRLYPASRRNLEPREKVVAELEDELQEWLRVTPVFFHPEQDQFGTPEDVFYDVPWIFRRQQRTIQAAFYFTNMLIYRGELLKEFLHHAPSTPLLQPSSQHVKKCVDNALAVARMAADIAEDCIYNAVFWTTSHFTFSAISVLLVYLTLYREPEDRSTIESVVEKAMRGHRKLDNSVNLTAQRLLEESRSRARNIGSPATAKSSTTPQQAPPQYQRIQLDEGVDPATSMGPPEIWPGNDLFENLQYELGTFGDTSGFGMIMDIGFDDVAFPNALEPQSGDRL